MTQHPSGFLTATLLAMCPGMLIAAPDIQLTQSSAWNDGYNAVLTISNPAEDPAIDGWSLTWIDGPAVTSLWNGIHTVEGSVSTVSNESWNGVIPAGGTCDIGFTASGNWPPVFIEPHFNGLPIDILGDGEGEDDNPEDEPSSCPADLDGSGSVDISDVLSLISNWGTCPQGCPADLNQDGGVGINDLMLMIEVWGLCPDENSDNPSDDPDAARVVAYYIEWGIYGRDYQPADIPADKITHLNYAFANIGDDGRIAIGDPYAAIEKAYPGDSWDQPYRGTYNQINNVLKQAHPHLKTLISVGGWTWSGKFSDVALTSESRSLFADSCVDFIRTYNFDGVDIDWEYPVCCGLGSNTYRPEDRENYTHLLQALRDALDEAGVEDNRTYLLTIAAAGGVDKLDHYELADIGAICDWVNTMSYDFMGAWDLSITGHHSGLDANPDNPSPNDHVRLHYNAIGSVQPWLDAGVDAHKIVLGVPFYGRAWGGVSSTDHGLFQSATLVPPGTWDDWSSGATGINDFTEIESFLASGLYTRYWDDQAKVPWLYSPTEHGGHFISYDDAESMGHKLDYVTSNGLGGVMFWEITADRNESLLDVIWDAISVP